MKRISIIFVVMLSVVFSPPPALSAAYAEMTWNEKVQEADNIVIGNVEIVKYAKGGKNFSQYALIKIDSTIKGSAKGKIKIWTKTGFPEASIYDCKIGNTYVFFIKKAFNGDYVSVNGQFGLISIKK